MHIRKFYALIAALIFCSVSAQAQLFEPFKYRAEAGVTFSKVSNWGVGSTLVGLRASGIVEMPIRHSAFSLTTGVTLTNKGERSQFHHTRGDMVRTSLLYVQVPIDVNFHIEFDDRNTFILGTGPYLGYGLAGSSTLPALFKASGNQGAPFKRFEFGWGGTMTYVYDRYSFKLGLEHSLTNVMNTNASTAGTLVGSAHHGLLYLALGYRF